MRLAEKNRLAQIEASAQESREKAKALREAFKRKNDLVFLDFITDQTENVWPMVKAGKGLTEMLLGAEEL